MSQTQTDIELDDLRQAGATITKVPRLYLSKRMTGFNAAVYAGWIERWARHAAQNWPVVTRAWGVRLLFKSAKGLPAAIVGIGPSLDESVQELKYLKGRGLIIATDAALRPLLRHDIIPDLVVNYDAKEEQCSMWNTVEDRTDGITLVANSCTAPETINAWRGRILFFNMEQGDDEFATNILPCLYPHLGVLPNLGTVGNGAIYLAHLMGCGPIMLVGMDLCYQFVPDDSLRTNSCLIPGQWRYRCTDYRWEPADETAGLPARWKETENTILYDNSARLEESIDEEIKGVVYKTDEPLKFYRNSIVNNIGALGLDVVNCAPNGILKDLLPTMSLKEAVLAKCDRSIGIGESLVPHLGRIVPDCKADLKFEKPYWIPKGGANV